MNTVSNAGLLTLNPIAKTYLEFVFKAWGEADAAKVEREYIKHQPATMDEAGRIAYAAVGRPLPEKPKGFIAHIVDIFRR